MGKLLRVASGAMSVAASVAMAGCAAPAPEEVASQSAALTAQDVDFAPECQGVIDFANTASFATLDVYLPSNVAQNIVNARAIAPFVTLEDLSDVSQVGEARLQQIHGGALAEDFIESDCAGIWDELAVSTDDAQAMVSLVNTVSDTQLHDYLPNAWNGAVNLLNSRPFTQVSQIAGTSGIGPASFRTLRNMATLAAPFEELAAAVTALQNDADITTHFDWYELVTGTYYYYSLSGMVCFGVDEELLPNGTTIRQELADDAEIAADVEYAIEYADRYDELTVDPAPGLANLASLTAGRTFFGCYIEYSTNPWDGHNMAFFVDTETGFGVLTETRWAE